MTRTALLSVAGVVLLAAVAQAGVNAGLKQGTPDLKSAGPLAFGPDGVLFIGDSASAAVFAVDTGDSEGDTAGVSINVDGIDGKIADLLGTTARGVAINDMAVNPQNGNLYLSVSRGRGPDASPALFKVDASGKLSAVSLENVPFAKAELPNAPGPNDVDRRNQPKRSQSITDIDFVDGRVFVAGLSNEEFESTLRSIPFPFKEGVRGTGVKIYHGSHAKFETQSPVRTFTHYNIGDEPYLLAGYTCTPLVKFPVKALKPGQTLEGVTIAELGNHNRPLDMFVYKQGGKDYILMANSSRGVMKVTTDGIDDIKPITQRVPDTAGLKYQTIEELQGVVHLSKLNDTHAVALIQTEGGPSNVRTIPLP